MRKVTILYWNNVSTSDAPNSWDETMQSSGNYKRKKENPWWILFFLLCDSGGIQTHNLLIRSQMLYSVELRNLPWLLISDLRMQRYVLFLNQPNIFGVFFQKEGRKVRKSGIFKPQYGFCGRFRGTLRANSPSFSGRYG